MKSGSRPASSSWAQKIATQLVRQKIHPNTISVLSVFFAARVNGARIHLDRAPGPTVDQADPRRSADQALQRRIPPAVGDDDLDAGIPRQPGQQLFGLGEIVEDGEDH